MDFINEQNYKKWLSGSVAILIAIFLLCIFATAINTRKAKLGYKFCTNDTLQSPPEYRAVLVDLTDKLSQNEEDAIRYYLADQAQSIEGGGVISLFTLKGTGRADNENIEVVTECTPSKGFGISETDIKNNTETLINKFNLGFNASNEPASCSEIIESLHFIARHIKASHPKIPQGKSSLLIVSDFIQRSCSKGFTLNKEVLNEQYYTDRFARAVKTSFSDIKGLEVFGHLLRSIPNADKRQNAETQRRQLTAQEVERFWSNIFKTSGIPFEWHYMSVPSGWEKQNK